MNVNSFMWQFYWERKTAPLFGAIFISFSFCFWNSPYNFITILIRPRWPIWCHVLLKPSYKYSLCCRCTVSINSLLLGCVCLWHWKASMERTVNTTLSIQAFKLPLVSWRSCIPVPQTDPGVRLPSFIHFFCDGTFYLILWNGMLISNGAGGRGFWSLLAEFLSFRENSVVVLKLII